MTVVDNTPINVNNVLIENVQGYVYLGQHYSLKEKNQDKEIQRRIMAGWAAYAKHILNICNDMFLCCCSLLFLPIYRKYIRIDKPTQEDARDGEDVIVADADGAAAYSL